MPNNNNNSREVDEGVVSPLAKVFSTAFKKKLLKRSFTVQSKAILAVTGQGRRRDSGIMNDNERNTGPGEKVFPGEIISNLKWRSFCGKSFKFLKSK